MILQYSKVMPLNSKLLLYDHKYIDCREYFMVFCSLIEFLRLINGNCVMYSSIFFLNYTKIDHKTIYVICLHSFKYSGVRIIGFYFTS